MITGQLSKAIDDVLAEALSAAENHAPMHSAHEGLGVIEEEWHELELEIYKNPRKR